MSQNMATALDAGKFKADQLLSQKSQKGVNGPGKFYRQITPSHAFREWNRGDHLGQNSFQDAFCSTAFFLTCGEDVSAFLGFPDP